MKNLIYFKTFLFLIVTFVCVSSSSAQDAKPAEPPKQAGEQRTFDLPPRNLGTSTLRKLGLTEEQMQQIRKLKSPTLRPMLDAYKQAREATRLLDEAIYADYADDADIQNKLQQLQQAQAEVARLKYMNELAVRRILTLEQLIRFREMRQKYENERQEKLQQSLEQLRKSLDIIQQRPGKNVSPTPGGQPPLRRVRPVKEKPVL